MNTKHTAGPWLYAPENASFISIVEPDGTLIFSMGALVNSTGHANIEANARLVACAPEMLEALQNAGNVLAALATGQLKTIERNSPALMQIRAAIAKATS